MNVRAVYVIPKSAFVKALLFFSYLIIPIALFSQNCQIPVLNEISSITDISAQLSWEDTNNQIDYWEIEFGERGFVRSFEANIEGITTPSYTINGLSPGRSYELYLRSKCPNEIYSPWNGPYFFSTAIRNNGECDLNLPISDNNCPDGDRFNLVVDGYDDLRIGQDIEFKSVSITIEHSWPPDLQISLQSPSGIRCNLFKQSGNGNNNLGDPLSADCENTLVFNPFSCLKLDNHQGQFEGEFIPIENFQELFAGEKVSGTWSLIICDAASSDLGILKHLELEFGEVSCTRPKDFHIRDIEATTVKLDWTESNNCDRIKLLYRRKSDPPSLSVVEFEECFRSEFTITGLDASTEYILDVSSVCMGGLESQLLCTQEFTTACKNSTLSESFDDLRVCNLSCQETCFVGDIWDNQHEDLVSSWKVNTEATPTGFTGPLSDIAGTGNYLYTEASLNCLIDQDTLGVLKSPCLELKDENSCHLSFYYNMNTDSSAQLQLQLNIGSGNWFTFWLSPVLQSTDWQFVQLNLPPISNHFEMRFVALRDDESQRADIALDQIKLIALDSVSLNKYYPDRDQDGYGQGTAQFMCSSSAPPLFSSLNGDCDDQNPLINPSAVEIPCNGVDDNCNGIEDELGLNALSYSINSLTELSCVGSSDGAIELLVEGDNPPYLYDWNNGGNTPVLNGLSSGSYVCTITDSNECQLLTDSIHISGPQALSYSFSVSPESCRGASDATIELFISGGTNNYSVSWNSGDTGEFVEALTAGFYQASIRDGNSCFLLTDSIEIKALSVINADVILKRNLDCYGENTGIAQVAAFGGQGPYTYSWSNGTSGNLLSDVPAGNYSVSITDANSCIEIIDDIVLEQSDELKLSLVQIENIACAGTETGSIYIEVTGGVEPYEFSWSDGTSNKDLIAVQAGTYSLTLTDANACTSSLDDLVISESSALEIDLNSIENIRCQNSSGGSIELQINGGTPPYIYNWSHLSEVMPNLAKVENLEAGIYSVTVSDYLGCKSKLEGIPLIVEDETINVSLILEDSPSCFGDDDAAIIAVNNNGVMPLDFNWSSGKKVIKNMRSDTLSSLVAGIYNLTITDAEGCVGVSDSIVISNPAPLKYQSISLNNNPCFGLSEGSIELVAYGGTGDIEVIWNNSQTGGSISMLSNGDYWASIVDANNCILETESFKITSPSELILELDIRNAEEELDGQVTAHVSGGLRPYSFEWMPDDGAFLDSLAQNLTQGEYHLRIIDANGCTIDSLIVIDFVSSTAQSITDMFKIFPNPSSQFVEWQVPYYITDVNLILYGKHGKILFKKKLSQMGDSKLDLRQLNLRSGVYMLSFESKAMRILKRIVFIE